MDYLLCFNLRECWKKSLSENMIFELKFFGNIRHIESSIVYEIYKYDEKKTQS